MAEKDQVVWEHGLDGGLAEFDPTKRYRYRLRRVWGDPSNSCCFVMLNPSTADAFRNDPTIRRCLGFAQAWGHGALSVVNLFAWRATDPRELAHGIEDPVGPGNDVSIEDEAGGAGRVVFAWGADPMAVKRGAEVARWLRKICDPVCLGTTKAGAPRHPLYVPAATLPTPYPAPEVPRG